MLGYIRRLLAGGAAYQSASLVSAALALITLPLYTRKLTPTDFGLAETLLTFIILASILLRAGLGEAFVRSWYQREDAAERAALTRTALGGVLVVTTVASLICLAAAEPLSELLLARSDAELLRVAVVGLWAFTNLEMAYALLRVQEARRVYLRASMANVVLTVSLTVTLVVILDLGAPGYLAGNYVASGVILFAVWWSQRAVLRADGPRFVPTGPLLRFGVPTVPAEAAVFALNVVDRAYLLRASDAAAAGLYALAVKLATIVIVTVRAFQLAWPPLAYSVTDDDEARRLYAVVCTWYVVTTGLVVAGLTLLGRWLVRLLAGPEFASAYEALPWVALGWAMYGLLLLLVTVGGRAGVTTRNFPAAALGLAANVIALVLLVDPLGIAGAGIALCIAYAVMLVALHFLTRSLFHVPFEWPRLAHVVVVLAGVSVAGELLLPATGVAGFVTRALALAAIPAVLALTGFMTPAERAGARRIATRQ
ncbi:MAG: lipopolysaccharide biosynthesis protein [Solirubrobacteraceae bacterium]|nr:lipopolysaccharide biosynthesis protein [Solirubrobacteraceae bacterium]